ncbi:MAG: hypothetical protein R3B70_32890 [Polyangiaceae bacterium]
MRGSVELFEHEKVRVGEPLRVRNGSARRFTEAEHRALARFNETQGGRFFRIGHRSITATQYVGYLEVGDLAIEILPKADRRPLRPESAPAWRHGLLEMLRAATDLRLETPHAASQRTGRATLMELIARRFVDEVERLLREGLAKGYRDEESNGPTFRGKLLFPQHLRDNLVRPDRFHVRYATFDRDILVNRILRVALGVLRGLALSPDLAARSAACAAAFPDVRGLRVTSEILARVVLGRTTARYRDALVLARMILEQRAPELRAGEAPVFAILFDMNLLWERYVASLFRKVAGRRFDVVTQESRSLWREPGQPSRIVRADLVVRPRGEKRVLLVADTKWRDAPAGVPGDEELKQMFVYNELLGAPRAVLLYPSTGPATDRAGQFAARAHPHGCETLHLGVIAGEAWSRDRMMEQIEGLLRSLSAVP